MKFLLAACSILVGTAPCSAADFYLICVGSGASDESSTVTTQSKNALGDTENHTNVIPSFKRFEGEATVEIIGNKGRIRLPRALLPTLHGGKDGWFELRNLKETEVTITAKAAISFMDRPNVRLDRLTGSIEIDGSVGNFAGRCKRYEPADLQRVF